VGQGGCCGPATPRQHPTLLSLNDELVILAVDISPKQAIIALVDVNMRFSAREVVPLVPDPEAALGKIVLSLQAMRSDHPRHTFEEIGMSMPGRIDPESQRLALAPNLETTRWLLIERCNLRHLRKLFGSKLQSDIAVSDIGIYRRERPEAC